MPAPVAAAALALEPLARAGLQLANTPVLGWERVESRMTGRKRPVAIVERQSFTLRAWEVAALAGVGLVFLWSVNTGARQGGFTEIEAPWWLKIIAPPTALI